jgi:hypothetical protein
MGGYGIGCWTVINEVKNDVHTVDERLKCAHLLSVLDGF